MNRRTISLCLLITALLCACSGGSGSESPPPLAPPPPDPPPAGPAIPEVDVPIAYNDVAVHDPSIVQSENGDGAGDGDGDYFVIGSHLAMARSPDFVTWELIANGVDDANPLFDTYAEQIEEGIAWTGGHIGSWAPDIIRLADGRYYFYYNHCATADDGLCDAPRSYLGVAVAEDIEGPYEDLGIFLYSGQTDAEIANGYGVGAVTSYDGNIHPNVIDPDVFHDKGGRLWMTYGSYAGGIFILEMDESTGKPLPGQGYGRHLAGGFFSAIEGSSVLYSPQSDYYYLFLSFGGYAAGDGYNIRIARSRQADGPYLDAAGRDMADAAGGWAAIEDFGTKLMGSFEFTADVGSEAPDRGYLSPGHNSAWYAAAAGRHFLVTHTRFPGRGEEHAVRVHEMFVNADDWLVVSPQRYAPMTGANRVGREDVAGTWQLVDHGRDINREPNRSRYVTLDADGAISGAVSGTWEFIDDSNESDEDIALTFDDAGTFNGILAWQWDEGREALTPVFSVLSPDGRSVWGSKLPDLSAAEVVQAVADALTVPATMAGGSLVLPVTGTHGAAIDWTSSADEVIAPDGTVIRPNVGEGDRAVTLTATITLGGEQATATYVVTVPQRQPLNRLAQWDFENDLADSLGNFPVAEPAGDRIWKTGAGPVAFVEGHEGHALLLDGSNGVRLPDGLLGNFEYTVSLWLHPATLTAFSPAFFGAVDEQASGGDPFSNAWISLVPQGWDGNTMLWSGSDPWFDGSAGERVPEATWTHLAFAVDNGLVTVFVNGEEKFSAGTLGDFFTGAEGRFALGVNYWDLPFDGTIDELRVYDAALSAGEIAALDIDYAPAPELLELAAELLDPGDLSALRKDIFLPPTGPFAASIAWESSDPAAIDVQGNTGLVTRPAAGAPPASVVLTATITLAGQSTTRQFPATVRSLSLPEPVAAYGFENNLDDSSGSFAAGVATGGFIAAAGGTIEFEDGVAGRALVLDGATGVALDRNILTDATWSVSLWMKPAALTAYTTALFGGPACATGPETCDSWVSVVPGGLGPDGDTMLWSGTAWYDALTGRRIPIGAWSQLTAVNDGGSIRVYVNGELGFAGENFPDVFSPASDAPADSQHWIGVNHWDPAYAGSIDEVRFYDVAMTADEVAARYAEAADP